jgi:hypothetical protein
MQVPEMDEFHLPSHNNTSLRRKGGGRRTTSEIMTETLSVFAKHCIGGMIQQHTLLFMFLTQLGRYLPTGSFNEQPR